MGRAVNSFDPYVFPLLYNMARSMVKPGFRERLAFAAETEAGLLYGKALRLNQMIGKPGNLRFKIDHKQFSGWLVLAGILIEFHPGGF